MSVTADIQYNLEYSDKQIGMHGLFCLFRHPKLYVDMKYQIEEAQDFLATSAGVTVTCFELLQYQKAVRKTEKILGATG